MAPLDRIWLPQGAKPLRHAAIIGVRPRRVRSSAGPRTICGKCVWRQRTLCRGMSGRDDESTGRGTARLGVSMPEQSTRGNRG
jgi:hypothetical protein